jgi:transcriptional regulator with XRE-family HTH domain
MSAKKSLKNEPTKKALEPSGQAPDVPLEKKLGQLLRQHRTRDGLTLTEVARGAQISSGMLSRIETGQATASFDALMRLAQTLGIRLSSLFMEVPLGGAQHVRKGQGMEVVRRGTQKGHAYQLLAYSKGPSHLFEPFLITLDDASEQFPSFEHPGTELIYMLEGKMEYRHGQQTYLLEPGDTLTFAGEIPHGPELLIDLPIRMVSVVIYGENTAS